MVLTKNEWIMVGAGRLFSAPLLSRVLLYRLHDIKCSILVYHDRTHVISDEESVSMVTEVQGLPAINIGHVVIATKVCESPIISIHYCPTSSSTAFEDLANLPATRMTIEECVSNVNHFGDIGFRLEPFALPYSRRLLASFKNSKTERLTVEGSNHIVIGPVDITEWPDRILIEKIRMNCWRIRLNCLKSNTRYEIGECSRWSLAALDLSDEGKLETEVCLENTNGGTRNSNDNTQ